MFPGKSALFCLERVLSWGINSVPELQAAPGWVGTDRHGSVGCLCALSGARDRAHPGRGCHAAGVRWAARSPHSAPDRLSPFSVTQHWRDCCRQPTVSQHSHKAKSDGAGLRLFGMFLLAGGPSELPALPFSVMS